MKKMLTVAEAAEALNISRITIYRMVERGEIPHKRLGRSIRIPASYITECEKKEKEIDVLEEARKYIFG